MRDHPGTSAAQAKDPKQLFSELWAALAKAQEADRAFGVLDENGAAPSGIDLHDLIEAFDGHVTEALEAFGGLSETSFFAATSAVLDVTFVGRS